MLIISFSKIATIAQLSRKRRRKPAENKRGLMGLRPFLICSMLLAPVHYSYITSIGTIFSHNGAGVLFLYILSRRAYTQRIIAQINNRFLEDLN